MMKVTLVVGNVQTMIQEGWFKRVQLHPRTLIFWIGCVDEWC